MEVPIISTGKKRARFLKICLNGCYMASNFQILYIFKLSGFGTGVLSLDLKTDIPGADLLQNTVSKEPESRIQPSETAGSHTVSRTSP